MDLFPILKAILTSHHVPGGSIFTIPTLPDIQLLGHKLRTGGCIAGKVVVQEEEIRIEFQNPKPRYVTGICLATLDSLVFPRSNIVVATAAGPLGAVQRKLRVDLMEG